MPQELCLGVSGAPRLAIHEQLCPHKVCRLPLGPHILVLVPEGLLHVQLGEHIIDDDAGLLLSSKCRPLTTAASASAIAVDNELDAARHEPPSQPVCNDGDDI